MKKELVIPIELYADSGELEPDDAELLNLARKSTGDAYAPYSRFRVAAAVRLANGKTLSGTNQENASYPAGICAERTLMSTASVLFPNVGIETIAISYDNQNGKSDRPISPCGICRQSFVEFQQRTKTPIRLILSGMKGTVQVIENAANLLPLSFSGEDMK